MARRRHTDMRSFARQKPRDPLMTGQLENVGSMTALKPGGLISRLVHAGPLGSGVREE